MNFNSIQKCLGLASLTFGGVILVSHSLSKPALAQLQASACPGIFYDEPFTSLVAAPAGCPLTEYSRELEAESADSVSVDPTNRTEEVRAVTISDEERESRLEALQQGVIIREGM